MNIQGSSSPFRSLHYKIPSGNDFTNPHLVCLLFKWFSITGPLILRCSIVTGEPGDLHVGGFGVFQTYSFMGPKNDLEIQSRL